MAGPRGDTKQRIQRAALDLFLDQGVRETSLRHIADRMGMTKPALYYYFSSREELVDSLITPMVEDMDALLPEWEANPPSPPELLNACFDFYMRHRKLTRLLTRELSLLSGSQLGARILDWRRRVTRLLAPDTENLEDQTRAVVALGGLADCTVLFPDTDGAELRTATITASLAALGHSR